jgi:hypothetical protein
LICCLITHVDPNTGSTLARKAHPVCSEQQLFVQVHGT